MRSSSPPVVLFVFSISPFGAAAPCGRNRGTPANTLAPPSVIRGQSRPGPGRNPGTPANTLAPRIWTRKPPRQCRPQLRPFNPDPDETVDLGQDFDGDGRPVNAPAPAMS